MVLRKVKNYLYDVGAVKQIMFLLFLTCTLLFAADFAYHRHVELEIEKWPGFYAVYGFVACTVLVFLSRFVLRPLVMRKETYYD